jgi:hypothetical protein
VATIRNEISSAKEQARVAIKTALPMVQEEQSDGAKFNGDVAGGALQVVDWKKKSATMADECMGFLDLVWHAAR